MNTSMSDTMVKDYQLDNVVVERLVTARIGLLLKAPFFGNLATRLKLVNADDWCPTAATDGRSFYYNTTFIQKLSNKELEFLFGHEVLHVVYDHMGRRDDRDPKLWNIADDYCVNADLIEQRIGERITKVPMLYDPKYHGWLAEQVYDDLFKNAKKISVEDLVKQLLDQHLEPGNENDGEGEGEPNKEGNRPGKLSKEEYKKLRDEIKEAVLSAAQASGAGNIPSGVKRLIQDLTQPVMPWRELIQTSLTSAIKNDFTFNRPSRRGWHMDAIMPAMTPGEEIDVDVFMDLSGSISDKMSRDILTEIAGMMESFNGYRINVACFDTEVYNPQTFTSDNLDSIHEYQLVGGGGTDFTCIFNYLKDQGRTPNRLIIFTDGYPFGSWGDENYCDTVFIIHGSKNITPPFGIWAYYDEHQTAKH